MFKDESAAQAILGASPMRYRLVSNSESGASNNTIQDDNSDVATYAQVEKDQGGEQEKVFELSISPSYFDHQHHIANEPMFGPWMPIDRKHSFFGGGLEISPSLMSGGLRDWETNGNKWRNAGEDSEGDRKPLEGLGVRSLGANGSAKDGINIRWRVDQRRKKRLEEQRQEGVMGGLKRYSNRYASATAAMEGEEK